MYVYRVMSSGELIGRLNGDGAYNEVKGTNTFDYKDGENYIHFYKFATHAFQNKEKFGCIVAKVKLDDINIPPLEYGLYPFVITDYDVSLSQQLFPIPEIIINRELFSNNCIIDFSNVYTKEFAVDEEGFFPLEVYVTKKNFFKKNVEQLWTISDVYYEYIKSLLPLYNYNMYDVVRYLKTIDLDIELSLMAKQLQNRNKYLKRKKKFY